MDYAKARRNKALQAKEDERKEVKKFFVDTGDFDNLMKIIKEKERDKPNINELPF